MADESFMLLSLKESQSKKLAQVIGSDSCRRILDYLTQKEFATESEAARELGMPLSTVHYNLRALVASGLVVADEFHYSGKGREVPHYKLAKKFIIIAPKDEQGVLERIKRFWPLAAAAVGVAAVLELGQRLFTGATLVADQVPLAEPAAAGVRALASEAAPLAAQEASRSFPTPLTLWFLGGALFVILVMVARELARGKGLKR